MKKTINNLTLILLINVTALVLLIIRLPSLVTFIAPDAAPHQTEITVICLSAGLSFFSMYFLFLRPMANEIKNRIELQNKLLAIEMNNHAVIEALPDKILRISTDGTLLEYKSGPQDYLHTETGKRIEDVLDPEIAAKLIEYQQIAIETGQVQTFEVMLQPFGIQPSYKECRLARCNEYSVIAIVRDITEQKNTEKELWHLSTHDALTGLFNRSFYEAEVANLAKSRNFPVSTILLDIDGLKHANDTRGHAAGDKLICMTSRVLKKAFRAEDIVARIGGDEFVVLLPKTDHKQLKDAMQRIYRCLENENRLESECRLELSLGTATAETNDKLIESLKIADKKMYQDKRSRAKSK
jgi:diguanylate cyclase (GGDEF)-like protein